MLTMWNVCLGAGGGTRQSESEAESQDCGHATPPPGHRSRPYLIFVIFSPQAQFLAPFFSTQKPEKATKQILR